MKTDRDLSVSVHAADVIEQARFRLKFLALAAEGFDHGDKDAAIGLHLLLMDTRNILATLKPGGAK